MKSYNYVAAADIPSLALAYAEPHSLKWYHQTPPMHDRAANKFYDNNEVEISL